MHPKQKFSNLKIVGEKKIRIYSLFKEMGCNLKKLYANSLYMEVCSSLIVPLFLVQHVLYEC
jgi:hypothetical protein